MNIIINNPQKAECFASIFQHIKVFTEHINIMFDSEKMYIQSMDNSRVSIFEINLPSDWFDVYTQTNDESCVIGVNASILFRILNARDKTQQINLIYDKSRDRLEIHFTGENKSEFDKHFEIGLIDIESEIMNIPPIDYQAEFTLESSNFANIINQLKMFGDTIEVKCSEEKIILGSSSSDQGKMYVEIDIDDLSSFIINEGESVNLSFSLMYLHNICLYNKIAKEVDVKLSEDYPMQILYKLPGHDDATIKFFLAPKINDDDD
jgi:proliferating cell nuclear antigen PCNA